VKTDETDDYQEKRGEKEAIYKILDRFTRLCPERIDKAELGRKTVRDDICRIQNSNFISKYPVNSIIRVKARGKYRQSLVYTSTIVINVTRVTPLFPSTILTNLTPVYPSNLENNVTYTITPTHISECNVLVMSSLYTLVYSSTIARSYRSISRLFSMHKEGLLTSLTESHPVYISIGGN